MVREPLPRGLKKAIERLEAEPERPWRLCDLAALCGVSPRTLQKHFRRFVGSTPRTFLRELRFDRARQGLLSGSDEAQVTGIATRCGFDHLGRFAAEYRRRYGETPSTTLRRARRASAPPHGPLPVFISSLDRPAVALPRFDHIGPHPHLANTFADEIALAIWRLNWIRVKAPSHTRYHLHGSVRENAHGVRLTIRLIDSLTGQYLWAAAWDGERHDPFGLAERVGIAVARAVQPALRGAEVERASRLKREELTAWELTMRALPCVTSIEASGESMALELLDEAMELAPRDPLPISIAAWCHGLRAGHHFTAHPDAEKVVARELAGRAARLNCCDALAETMLAAGYTLAHDLDAAAVHAERALELDGGSAWAWGRSAWIKAYRGQAQKAIEEFQIARSLAPVDSLNFLWSVGIAAAEFQMAHYDESIRWYDRALAENPASTWTSRFLAPAYVLAGRLDDARRTIASFTTDFPNVTISAVRAGLPWNALYLDRVSEGLEHLGMRS
jgi:AraC-like DNA-binding protein/tetratricopeptide (TPR) repeat protein